MSATTPDADTPAAPAPALKVEAWHGARTLAAGPWRSGHQWLRRAACRAPGVDPGWFTVDEDAPGADELIAKAKQVCRGCPVRLWCRIHADETGREPGRADPARPGRGSLAGPR